MSRSTIALLLVAHAAACSLSRAQSPPTSITIRTADQVDKEASAAWMNLADHSDYELLDQFIATYPTTQSSRYAFAIRYSLVRKAKSIDDYNDFLELYPDRLITPVAIQEVFELYHQRGTIGDYIEFIRRYAGTAQARVAKLHIQALVFATLLKHQSDLPVQPNRDDAVSKRRYLEARRQLIEEFDGFVLSFPDAPQANIASKAANALAAECERIEKEAELNDKPNAKFQSRADEISTLMNRLVTAIEEHPNSYNSADLVKAARYEYLLFNVYIGSSAARDDARTERDRRLVAAHFEALQKSMEHELANVVRTIKDESEKTRTSIRKLGQDIDSSINNLTIHIEQIHGDLQTLAAQVEQTNAKLDMLQNDLREVANKLDGINTTLSVGFANEMHELVRIEQGIHDVTQSLKDLARTQIAAGESSNRFPPFPLPKLPRRPELPKFPRPFPDPVPAVQKSLKSIPDIPLIKTPKNMPACVADGVVFVNNVASELNAAKTILFDSKQFPPNPRSVLLPLLIEASPASWLEKPDPIVVNPLKSNRRPIYFVNGIWNLKREAIENATKLSMDTSRPVLLIFNPSGLEGSTGTIGCGESVLADLRESVYDRLWPINFFTSKWWTQAAMDRAVPIGDDLLSPFGHADAAHSILSQPNPTCRQIAYILDRSDGPITIVSHSQGCMITRNSILMMRLLQKGGKLKDNLVWIAAAPPLHAWEIDNTACHEYGQIINEGDPVPEYLGLRTVHHKRDDEQHKFENYRQKVVAELKRKDPNP